MSGAPLGQSTFKMVAQDSDSLVVSGHDYLTSCANADYKDKSVGTSLFTFELNPMNFSNTRLKKFAEMYSRFEIACTIHLKTAVGTNMAGAVAGFWERDIDDPFEATGSDALTELLVHKGGHSVEANKGGQWTNPPPPPDQSKWYVVQNEEANRDVVQAKFYLISQNSIPLESIDLGIMYVTYHCKFWEMRLKADPTPVPTEGQSGSFYAYWDDTGDWEAPTAVEVYGDLFDEVAIAISVTNTSTFIEFGPRALAMDVDLSDYAVQTSYAAYHHTTDSTTAGPFVGDIVDEASSTRSTRTSDATTFGATTDRVTTGYTFTTESAPAGDYASTTVFWGVDNKFAAPSAGSYYEIIVSFTKNTPVPSCSRKAKLNRKASVKTHPLSLESGFPKRRRNTRPLPTDVLCGGLTSMGPARPFGWKSSDEFERKSQSASADLPTQKTSDSRNGFFETDAVSVVSEGRLQEALATVKAYTDAMDKSKAKA